MDHRHQRRGPRERPLVQPVHARPAAGSGRARPQDPRRARRERPQVLRLARRPGARGPRSGLNAGRAGDQLGVLGEPLGSTQNALVKRAASLRQRKFREREGAFLVEGADLVVAGIAAGHRPQVVFVRAERALGLSAEGGPAADGAHTAPPAVYPVAERVAEKISTLETPPDVMAVFPLPERRALTTLPGTGGALGEDAPPGAAGEALVVFVDGIGDPGNMGTLLRAAVAFGATALATALGSADLYGPKTVRAGMGAVFGLPLFPALRLADVLAALPGAAVYGLAAVSYTHLTLPT